MSQRKKQDKSKDMILIYRCVEETDSESCMGNCKVGNFSLPYYNVKRWIAELTKSVWFERNVCNGKTTSI